jgi:hypothetical protein
MADDKLDLEEYWQDVRPMPFISGSESASKLKESLDVAYEKANERMGTLLKESKYRNAALTGELFAEIISKGVAFFMEEWHEGLRNQNLAGLIEIVLEGQDLTPSEMEEFVRALPGSLLERICKSATGTASGIHGLMAMEFARRNNHIRDYSVLQDGGRAYVKFTDLGDREVRFYLDESFELGEEEPSAVPSV